jgi:NitT/TauT family transport system substrate-binding protein
VLEETFMARRLRVLAALAALIIPSGLALAAEKVSVGVVNASSDLPFFIADARGYLKEEGIEANFIAFDSAAKMIAPLGAGQLDVGGGAAASGLYNAVERGIDIRIVADKARNENGFQSFLIRKALLDSGQVKGIADLKGRKVALAGGTGSTGSYWVATKLRQANLSLKDIDVVNLGFPEMVAAFETRAIDAAYPSAPATTQIKNAGTADYFGGITAPGASAVGTTFSGAFIKNRPDVARRVMVALVKGARDVQGANYLSPQNLKAYETYTATPVATLQTMDAYDFDPNLAPDAQTLDDMQRVFIDQGILQLPAPLPTSEYIDASFQQAAVQGLR